MKNLTKLLISLLLLTVLIGSCKKDKDDNTPAPTPTSYLNVNGVQYILTQGTLENYGQDDVPGDGWDFDGYNLDLALVSSGFTITSHGDTAYEATGSGQVIYLEMFTSNGSFLDNGEYNLDTTQPSPIKSFDIHIILLILISKTRLVMK